MKPKYALVISDYLLKNSEGKFVFSTLEICAKHNIQDSTLYRILKSNSVPRRQQHCTRRYQKFPKEFKLSVIRDYLEKNTSGFTFTILQICDKFDIDEQSLYSFLHEFGIPLRNRVLAFEGNITVRKRRSSIKDLECRISEIVADYNAEDRWGRVYTIKELCERYNTVPIHIYKIFRVARQKGMYLSVRREIQWLD